MDENQKKIVREFGRRMAAIGEMMVDDDTAEALYLAGRENETLRLALVKCRDGAETILRRLQN